MEQMGSDYTALSDQEMQNIQSGIDFLLSILNMPAIIVYKSLNEILAALHLNLEREEIPDDESSDYKAFEKNFLGYLGFFEKKLLEQLITT